MKILSASQLHEADSITLVKQGIDSAELMERAATKVFDWLHKKLQSRPSIIHIFCGIGNNGGDGLVVGRLLIESGYNVKVYVVDYSEKRSKDFLINYDRLEKMTNSILIRNEDDFPEIRAEDVIVDAIFGIGLNRSPEGWVKKMIQYLNASEAFRLAIDIPSGLFANIPVSDMEAVFKADVTLTFQAPKLSFFLPETAPFVSDFEVLNIGLDSKYIHNSTPLAQIVQKSLVQKLYLPREKFGHKGTYGHGLIVAGSYGKIGAAVLSTRATLKAGAGMVTAFIPKCGYQIMQTAVPEAMVGTDEGENCIEKISIDFNPAAVGVGMGIGKNILTARALGQLFQNYSCPFVIDADALNLISDDADLMKMVPINSILTPHPGELKRLIGSWNDDYDKLEKTKSFSQKQEVVVVIKGAFTTIVFGDKLFINSTGNPGMGTAGSGDVLSGILTGLLCQGYDPISASIFGVYIHGRAGDIASHQFGYEALIASHIIENIGNAYMDLFLEDEAPKSNVHN